MDQFSRCAIVQNQAIYQHWISLVRIRGLDDPQPIPSPCHCDIQSFQLYSTCERCSLRQSRGLYKPPDRRCGTLPELCGMIASGFPATHRIHIPNPTCWAQNFQRSATGIPTGSDLHLVCYEFGLGAYVVNLEPLALVHGPRKIGASVVRCGRSCPVSLT